jgi:hypothetical protein
MPASRRLPFTTSAYNGPTFESVTTAHVFAFGKSARASLPAALSNPSPMSTSQDLSPKETGTVIILRHAGSAGKCQVREAAARRWLQ